MALVEPSQFPTELLLEVMERLTFGNGSNISNLARTHTRLRAVLGLYEHSLVRKFAQNELKHAHVDFPSEQQGYKWLRDCVQKYDVVDDLMAMLISKHNAFPTPRHNMALVNAGLLLLYKVQSCGRIPFSFALDLLIPSPVPRCMTYEPDLLHPVADRLRAASHTDKLCFLKTLPKDPLTAMYLAIHHATLTARYHGEGIIHQRTYGRFMDASQISLRCDIEFCFAEASMQLGPAFIHSSLLPIAAACSPAEVTLLNLYHDHAIHDWYVESVMEGVNGFDPPITQGPRREGGERSLWTALLERVAELMQCPLENVRGAIEEDVAQAYHELAWLGLDGKATLMKGEDLVPALVE